MSNRICILNTSAGLLHKATGKADCRHHDHCTANTAFKLIESLDAVWTNPHKTAIYRLNIAEWRPTPSDGYTVLQLVSG